jgi:hypothetical protein
MRMRSLVLTFAITAALGVCEPARAVHINPQGLGQALLFPYYTVNGGNQTVLNVVNTTGRGKAIKLRFMEGYNSRDSLNFNLYLPPFDTWTAALFRMSDTDSEAPANLVTYDNNCTVPDIKSNPVLPQLANGIRYAPFLNYRYTGAGHDDGPAGLGRTREGHFEMIEMGEVVNREHTSLSDMLLAGNTGMPANCARLRSAWLPSPAGYWRDQPGADMDPPGGGLYANAAIVDALNGTMLAYHAEALDAFSSVVQHAEPGNLDTLATLANPITDAAQNVSEAGVLIDGAWTTLRYPTGTQAVDAVSALFAAEVVHNDFVTSATVGGASEWVVTMPTKAFYTNGQNPQLAQPPFARGFSGGRADVDVTFEVWDREGGPDDITPLTTRNFWGCGFLCPPPPDITPQVLPWATTVLRFNQATVAASGTAILGSALSILVPSAVDDPAHINNEGHPNVADGRMRINLYRDNATEYYNQGATSRLHVMRPDLQSRRLLGLPVMGFWAVSYTNTAVTPGVLANYSGATRHITRAALAPPL